MTTAHNYRSAKCVTDTTSQTEEAFRVSMPAEYDTASGEVTMLVGNEALVKSGCFYGRFAAEYNGTTVEAGIGYDFGNAGLHADNGDTFSLLTTNAAPDVSVGVDSGSFGRGAWCFVVRAPLGDTSALTPTVEAKCLIRQRFGEAETTDNNNWVDITWDGSVTEVPIREANVASYRIQYTCRDSVSGDVANGLWFVTAKNYDPGGGYIGEVVGDTPKDGQSCPYDAPTDITWDQSLKMQAVASGAGIKFQCKGFTTNANAWRFRITQEVNYAPPTVITSGGPAGTWTDKENGWP